MKELYLDYWVNLCIKNDIPFVPAIFTNEFEPESYKIALDGKIKNDLKIALNDLKIIKTLFEFSNPIPYIYKYIVRTNIMSFSDIKHNIGTGKPDYNKIYTKVCFDNPRYFDLPNEVKTDKFVIRPFIYAIIINSYPLEFRVFFDKNGFIGISNYYPQRNLDDKTYSEDFYSIKWYMNKCIKYSNELYNSDTFEDGFTADFIIRENDHKVLFLEGNPSHGKGGHLCCYENKEELYSIKYKFKSNQKIEVNQFSKFNIKEQLI